MSADAYRRAHSAGRPALLPCSANPGITESEYRYEIGPRQVVPRYVFVVQLTERTDLALRLLLYLAVHEGGRVSVSVIARAFHASESHLAKVSQALAHAGFLDTSPGRTGGVRLARPAADIRVGDVVRAIEPLRLVECFTPGGACPVTGVCGLEPALKAAREAFLTVLDGVSLASAAGQRAAIRARIALPEE